MASREFLSEFDRKFRILFKFFLLCYKNIKKNVTLRRIYDRKSDI